MSPHLGIVSGIPLHPWLRRSRTRSQLEACKVGDSFLVGTRNGRKSLVYHFAKKLGIKVATRQLGDGRMRVWRIA